MSQTWQSVPFCANNFVCAKIQNKESVEIVLLRQNIRFFGPKVNFFSFELKSVTKYFNRDIPIPPNPNSPKISQFSEEINPILGLFPSQILISGFNHFGHGGLMCGRIQISGGESLNRSNILH